MLRDLWNKLTGRRSDDGMTAEELRIAGRSEEDRQADAFVREHLGGADPRHVVEQPDPHEDLTS